MKKIVLAACLLTSTTVCAEQTPKQMLDNIFSHLKVHDFQPLQVDEGDTLLFLDGEHLRGVLDNLNDHLHFDPAEIAAIVFDDQEEIETRVHYITNDGKTYHGRCEKNSLAFVEKLSSHAKNDSDDIHVIVRKKSRQPLTQQTYTLALNDGEELTVFLPEQTICVSDGSREWMLSSDQIRQIYQDGWLFGEYVDDNGHKAEFGYAYANDRKIAVQLVDDNRTIEIPWYKIAGLSLDVDTNNSYYPQQRPKDSYVAEESSRYSTAAADAEVDSIGSYAHEGHASLEFEYLLPPEIVRTEKQAMTRIEEPEKVFADYCNDEVPRNITFTHHHANDDHPAALQRASHLSSPYDLAFEDLSSDDTLDDYTELEDSIEDDDEDDDEEIIFISRKGDNGRYDDLAFADQAFSQELDEETWDDIDADFFVDITEDYDVDALFDDFDLGLDDLD